nr:immunoglobulin heavy chain junction region [Mus musculus]NSM05617.1 immunoglobulin heavy chain junction region [Mus musculus]NSM08308.1 immunoglobulin heavy chain junction region [Mus musculus]NSM09215.1 immunoglobulin heavy chain junction region [Mus musculus]
CAMGFYYAMDYW